MAFTLPGLIHSIPVTEEQRHMLTRARRGGAARAKTLNGYVTVGEHKASFGIQWRWKSHKEWHAGSVRTREEAQALAARLRAAIARGEEPEPMPHYRAPDARLNAPGTSGRSADEIAAARARMRAIMANPERCKECGMLKPCAPCVAEIREMARGARR